MREVSARRIFGVEGRDFPGSVTPIYERGVFLFNECEEGRVAGTWCALASQRRPVKLGLDKVTPVRYITFNAALLTFCLYVARYCSVSAAQRRYSIIETTIGRTHGCGLACLADGVSTGWGVVYGNSTRSGQATRAARGRSIVPLDALIQVWLSSCLYSVRRIYLFVVVVPVAGTPVIDKQGKRPTTIAHRGYALMRIPLFFQAIWVQV